MTSINYFVHQIIFRTHYTCQKKKGNVVLTVTMVGVQPEYIMRRIRNTRSSEIIELESQYFVSYIGYRLSTITPSVCINCVTFPLLHGQGRKPTVRHREMRQNDRKTNRHTCMLAIANFTYKYVVTTLHADTKIQILFLKKY